MTEYTREEVYKAHDALEYLIQNLYDVSFEEAKDTDSYKKLVKFLPSKPKPTVLDEGWDDEEDRHRLATHKEISCDVVMLQETYDGRKVYCLVEPETTMAKPYIVALDKDTLTPQSWRYFLEKEK